MADMGSNNCGFLADDRARVRAATASLPFEEAHAIWLVDVCGCSYADAAIQSCTDVESIRRRVDQGRRRVRTQFA